MLAGNCCILCMNAASLSIVVVKTFQDLFSRTWNILDTSLRNNLSELYPMLTNMRRDSAHTDKRGGVCYAISKGMHGKMEVVNSLHCRSFLSDRRHDMVMPLVDTLTPGKIEPSLDFRMEHFFVRYVVAVTDGICMGEVTDCPSFVLAVP